MKLLVATRHSPLPENDGSGAYLFDLLSYLRSQGVDIEIAWLAVDEHHSRLDWWRVPDRMSRVAHLSIIGCLAIGPWRYFHWGRLKARLGSWLRGRPASSSPLPTAASSATAGSALPSTGNIYQPSWSDLPTPLERRFFQKRLARFKPDAVLVNYCWLAPLLKDVPAALPTAVLTCDVISQRIPPNPALDPDAGTPEGEAALLKIARHAIAISAEDAASFRSRLPAHSIVLAPKAADIRPLPAEAIQPDRVLFVGGMNGFNREGLAWFLEHAWPLIRQTRPATTLHICGAIGSTVAQPPPGVVIRGRVPDLTAEYAAAAVVIVPLLQGSGVKIKLVEAASFGKAIVTTPIGLQGLDFLRAGVRETTTAPDFATAVLELLASETTRLELSRATLAAAKQHLSPESCYRPTLESLSLHP